MRRVLFFLPLFFSLFSYAGFSPDTVVLRLDDSISINQLQKSSSIINYDVTKNNYFQGIVNSHRHSMSFLSYKVLCDEGISFVASPEQLVRCSESWRAVRDLKQGDRLKCYGNTYATVLSVELCNNEQLLCEITVEPYHTFCVTTRGIIVHNSPAIVISAAPVIVPVIAKTVGVLATIGAALYSLFARNAGHNIGRNSIDNFSSCSTQPPPDDPRNKTKYKNMKQVFKESPIGEKLKKVTRRTNFRYKGAKIYKVIQDVEEWGIKKGDWLYLDTLHYDHLEVFDKSGEVVRTILNMDGTKNAMKLKQAGVRSIAECIG